ncbi:hypothetical protein GQ457_07G028430 [Hibiscus cannabinus]
MVSPTVSGGNNSGSSRGEDASVQMFSNKRINVCLDDTNFLLWKQQVILTIRGLGLEEYIDPDVTKPTRYVERAAGEQVLNPEYVQFVKQDSSLASWLLSTVSADILPQLVGADTSAEIWSVITGLYSKLSTTKIMHLHCKLRSMKKGAMSMREYTLKIKEVCDLLALSGRKVAEVEHIATILNGLPSEFAPFVAVITASKEPFSLDGVVSVLVDAESRLMVDVVESPIGINLSQFHATESTGGPDHNKSYSNQGRGRGSRSRKGLKEHWFDENFKGIGSQQIRQGDDPQANMCHYQGSGPYYEPFIADTAGISGVTGTVESSQPVEAAQINSLVASGISVNDAGGNSASDGVAQECNLPVCLPSSDLGNNDSENSVSTAPPLEAVSSTANEHSEASDSVSPDCFSGVPDLAANADYQEVGKRDLIGCRWIKPPVKSVKFNVDDAVEGGFGRTWIGGIFRDSNGKTLILFSKSVGLLDFTSAEIRVLKEAVNLFQKSAWANTFSLILETYCSSCVDWLHHPVAAISIFRNLIEDCMRGCEGLIWSVQAVLRLTNGSADKLVKRAIARTKSWEWMAQL